MNTRKRIDQAKLGDISTVIKEMREGGWSVKMLRSSRRLARAISSRDSMVEGMIVESKGTVLKRGKWIMVFGTPRECGKTGLFDG